MIISKCRRLETGTCNCTAYCGTYLDALKAQKEPVATLTIGAEDSERGTAKFNLLNYNLPVGEYKLYLASGAAQKLEPTDCGCATQLDCDGRCCMKAAPAAREPQSINLATKPSNLD